MLRLYLRDEKTEITVECPMTMGNPKTAITYAEWDLKSAVEVLARKVANKLGKSPHEILFSSPPFHIIAKWKVENGSE